MFEKMDYSGIWLPNILSLNFNEEENEFYVGDNIQLESWHGVFALVSVKVSACTEEDMENPEDIYYVTPHIDTVTFTKKARMTGLSAAFFNMYARLLSSQGPKIYKSVEMNKTETVLAILPRLTVKAKVNDTIIKKVKEDLDNAMQFINASWQSDVNEQPKETKVEDQS